MSNTLKTLSRLFEGLTLGKVQEVGVMKVIPLIGEDLKGYAPISKDVFNGTVGYGVMQFKNTDSNNIVIVPSGFTVFTKQAAQDHASPFPTVVKPNSVTENNACCCVEQTQPGMINPSTVTDFNFLPLDVRLNHHKEYVERRPNNDFGRIWDFITKFQSELLPNNPSKAHLVWFFNHYMEKLTKFNAEFESVEGQRGAIILFNDKVVGIEITPSNEYWKSIWGKLIRDCYGSHIIKLAHNNSSISLESYRKATLDLSACQSIEDIEKSLVDYDNKVNRAVLDNLIPVFEEEVQNQFKNYSRNFDNLGEGNKFFKHSLTICKSKSLLGDIITENETDTIAYASLLMK